MTAGSDAAAINPFMDPRSAADNAQLVALVEVVASDERWVTVRVLRALRAPEGTSRESKVIQGLWNPSVGESFYLFVSAHQDALYVTHEEREAVRLVAGLPGRELLPDSVRLGELHGAADAVVHGTAYATSPSTATLRVNSVDKGDIEVGDRLEVTVGYHTEEAGGPWTFDTDDYSTTHGVDGWFFLNRAVRVWSIGNPVHPARITPLHLHTIHEVLG